MSVLTHFFLSNALASRHINFPSQLFLKKRVNSSQDHAKIVISYRPFRTRPILGWGIHSDRQKWAQNNISIPIGYLKGPERAFFVFFVIFWDWLCLEGEKRAVPAVKYLFWKWEAQIWEKKGTKLSLSDPNAILRALIEHFWHFLLIFHVYEWKNATSNVINHLKGMDFNLPALFGNFTLFQEALSIL